MKLKDAMFLWTSEVPSPYVNQPRVVVVAHGSEEALKYKHLPKSMGACWGSWKRASPLGQAAHAMVLFHQMTVGHCIPAQEVDAAFMAIDEYREYRKGGALDNPFSDIYHDWASIPVADPESFDNWTTLGDAAKGIVGKIDGNA